MYQEFDGHQRWTSNMLCHNIFRAHQTCCGEHLKHAVPKRIRCTYRTPGVGVRSSAVVDIFGVAAVAVLRGRRHRAPLAVGPSPPCSTLRAYVRAPGVVSHLERTDRNVAKRTRLPDHPPAQRDRAPDRGQPLDRVEARAQRCTAENRDLTDREHDLTRADTEELTALRQAAVCQEQIESRAGADPARH